MFVYVLVSPNVNETGRQTLREGGGGEEGGVKEREGREREKKRETDQG